MKSLSSCSCHKKLLPLKLHQTPTLKLVSAKTVSFPEQPRGGIYYRATHSTAHQFILSNEQLFLQIKVLVVKDLQQTACILKIKCRYRYRFSGLSSNSFFNRFATAKVVLFFYFYESSWATCTDVPVWLSVSDGLQSRVVCAEVRRGYPYRTRMCRVVVLALVLKLC